MAWLEVCRIDAGKQVKHLREHGMSARQAIKKLSAESGITENTINNWVYARTASKRIDVFRFFIDTLSNDFIIDGFPADKVERFFSGQKIITPWVLVWLLTEEKYIRGWYLAAFEKYGKTAKITDMFRARTDLRTGLGFCPISQKAPDLRTGPGFCLIPKKAPRLRRNKNIHMYPGIVHAGYVNFNAIQEAGVS